jgi:hypothetical protein
MADPAVYTLNCFVKGGADSFEVDIAKGASVSKLKEAIKEKKSNAFANIDVDDFLLYQADFPDKELVKRVDEHLKANPSALRGTQKLKSLFPKLPKDDEIHIIIVRIPSG